MTIPSPSFISGSPFDIDQLCKELESSFYRFREKGGGIAQSDISTRKTKSIGSPDFLKPEKFSHYVIENLKDLKVYSDDHLLDCTFVEFDKSKFQLTIGLKDEDIYLHNLKINFVEGSTLELCQYKSFFSPDIGTTSFIHALCDFKGWQQPKRWVFFPVNGSDIVCFLVNDASLIREALELQDRATTSLDSLAHFFNPSKKAGRRNSRQHQINLKYAEEIISRSLIRAFNSVDNSYSTFKFNKLNCIDDRWGPDLPLHLTLQSLCGASLDLLIFLKKQPIDEAIETRSKFITNVLKVQRFSQQIIQAQESDSQIRKASLVEIFLDDQGKSRSKGTWNHYLNLSNYNPREVTKQSFQRHGSDETILHNNSLSQKGQPLKLEHRKYLIIDAPIDFSQPELDYTWNIYEPIISEDEPFYNIVCQTFQDIKGNKRKKGDW